MRVQITARTAINQNTNKIRTPTRCALQNQLLVPTIRTIDKTMITRAITKINVSEDSIL